MRCRQVLERSTAYVDGELDERRSRAVRGHLRTCAACAAALDEEARLRRAASELEPIEPPTDLWRRIEGRLAADEIAEADRSRLGLVLLCWLDRLRRHALSATVAVTAAVLVVVWLGDRAPGQRLLRASVSPPAASAATPEAAAAPTAAVAVEDAMAEELRLAIAHHQAAIAELGHELDGMAASLAPRQRRRLERERAAAVARIAARRAEVARPGGDSALLAAYRAEIARLTRAVSGGVTLAAIGPMGGE